ncbi:MAG: hypothetical protein LBP36_01230 [Oscillospiraceae bacterium]|jgi:hypothetical protein|nr:hypothetical protein [Oscillospiraceae bacterium]
MKDELDKRIVRILENIFSDEDYQNKVKEFKSMTEFYEHCVSIEGGYSYDEFVRTLSRLVFCGAKTDKDISAKSGKHIALNSIARRGVAVAMLALAAISNVVRGNVSAQTSSETGGVAETSGPAGESTAEVTPAKSPNVTPSKADVGTGSLSLGRILDVSLATAAVALGVGALIIHFKGDKLTPRQALRKMATTNDLKDFENLVEDFAKLVSKSLEALAAALGPEDVPTIQTIKDKCAQSAINANGFDLLLRAIETNEQKKAQEAEARKRATEREKAEEAKRKAEERQKAIEQEKSKAERNAKAALVLEIANRMSPIFPQTAELLRLNPAAYVGSLEFLRRLIDVSSRFDAESLNVYDVELSEAARAGEEQFRVKVQVIVDLFSKEIANREVMADALRTGVSNVGKFLSERVDIFAKVAIAAGYFELDTPEGRQESILKELKTRILNHLKTIPEKSDLDTIYEVIGGVFAIFESDDFFIAYANAVARGVEVGKFILMQIMNMISGQTVTSVASLMASLTAFRVASVRAWEYLDA